MHTYVQEDEAIEIPEFADLDAFRQWVDSDDYPEFGRVCYLDGEVWVDRSKEQLFTHNLVKCEYGSVLSVFSKAAKIGNFFTDGVLVSNVVANLSSKPDGTFVSFQSFENGLIELIEGEKEGYVELLGTPDMVLEILSAGSVKKDLHTLRDLYWRAGITEYWIVDVRSERLVFDILRYSSKGYVPVKKQAGWMHSQVFGKSFKLSRGFDKRGELECTLSVR